MTVFEYPFDNWVWRYLLISIFRQVLVQDTYFVEWASQHCTAHALYGFLDRDICNKKITISVCCLQTVEFLKGHRPGSDKLNYVLLRFDLKI